ncbi:MAG TPA: hypothetical protein VFU81_08030 [Thermomicrobiales bacterium]|nr:hypothetical protein [Thermomicrobiales bacterium]
MDGETIDSLARRLARGVGRRRVAIGIVGALTGALVGSNAAAACKHVGKKCDKSNDCCKGAKCAHHKCACKDGRTDCDGKCFDLETDAKHCAKCDNACAADRTCCSGTCVRLATNDRNCGVCGAACPPTQECVAGVCVTPPGGCAPGADTCTQGGNVIRCGVGNCGCSQTTEGTTVCGNLDTPGHCGECKTSADCASLGPGAFCVASGLPGSTCCGPDAENACRLPCPG